MDDKKEINKKKSRERYYKIKDNPNLLTVYLKKTANNVKKWRENNPEKTKAQRIVFMAVRNKSLKKQPCKICGQIKAECHHEDYSKPLEVIWLCKKHHMEMDIKRRNNTCG